MRLALVANARSGSEDRADRVADLLRDDGADVDAVALEDFCAGPEATDAERLADVARRLAGVDRVVVAGGDGSVGPAAALAARLGVPLAIVPIGTANDFARWLDLPLEVEDACRLATDPSSRTQVAELAVAAGRPFVNAASTGLSVLAAQSARPLKPKLGPLAYAAGALRAAVRGRPLRAAVRCDGEERFRGSAWQLVVAASGAFGGGSGTGGVDPTDQRLDVAIVEAGPRLRLAGRAWAMRRRRLVEEQEVRHVRGRVVEVEVDGEDARFNVDGEILPVDPARFAVETTFDVVVAR